MSAELIPCDPADARRVALALALEEARSSMAYIAPGWTIALEGDPFGAVQVYRQAPNGNRRGLFYGSEQRAVEWLRGHASALAWVARYARETA